MQLRTLKDIPFDATTSNLGNYPKYFVYIDDLRQEAVRIFIEVLDGKKKFY